LPSRLFRLQPRPEQRLLPELPLHPELHFAVAAKFLGADTIVLAFASGFVLIGAILGLWLCLTRLVPAELAFGVMVVLLTSRCSRRPSSGGFDYVQERYLFYILPLWTLAFLLYAARMAAEDHTASSLRCSSPQLWRSHSRSTQRAAARRAPRSCSLTWLVRPTGNLGAASVLIVCGVPDWSSWLVSHSAGRASARRSRSALCCSRRRAPGGRDAV
jgi:hypothetical protein